MPAARNQPWATSRPTDAVSTDPAIVRPLGEKPSRPRNRAGASATTRERFLISRTLLVSNAHEHARYAAYPRKADTLRFGVGLAPLEHLGVIVQDLAGDARPIV